MMEAERGVKGVEGRLLYECDMTGKIGDGAWWLLGYERLFLSLAQHSESHFSAAYTDRIEEWKCGMMST